MAEFCQYGAARMTARRTKGADGQYGYVRAGKRFPRAAGAGSRRDEIALLFFA